MTNLASNLPLVATIIYFSIVALLSSLAIHRYVVARASWRHPWKDPSPVEVAPESLPHVLLQLPLYNEAQVVGRLIDTVAELELLTIISVNPFPAIISPFPTNPGANPVG